MKRYWPILLLSGIVLLLGIVNYVPGATLTGWDNLHPEFDIFLNLRRAIFTTWQEYQGVGLLGGMGHGADLIRQLFLLPLTYIFSTHFIRYFYTILTLLIGTLGAFVLIKHVLKRHFSENTLPVLSFIGGLYYLLNLATLQQYYIAFEVFTTHFAALPWLFYSLLHFLEKRSRSRLALFCLILLLATPGGYVPTLFVVFLMATAILMLFSIPLSKSFSTLFTAAKQYVFIFVIIFLVNAFWLLPFAYFTFTSADVNVNAKINQMSTDSIFRLNKEFGNLASVIQLKGFTFNSVEPNLAGAYSYIMAPWKDHYDNLFLPFIHFLLFTMMLVGVIVAFRKDKSSLRGFATLFIFSFTMLATATPPFSWIDAFLRDYIPLFGQVFRFPFTKFSILTSLTYALFLAYALGLAAHWFEKKEKKLPHRYILPGLSGIVAVGIVFLMLPVFGGNLFYEKEQLVIPKEYNQVFTFFKNQNLQTRIANFPQPSFWSWGHTKWGYSGSGFLWYGIEQPILDRAFDPWSPANEQYYFEMSSALYAKDDMRFIDVMKKYQVSWLLIDKNAMNPSSPKALFISELHSILEKNTTFRKAAEFGQVEIYEFLPIGQNTSFVYTASAVPSVNASSWLENDTAFTNVGLYKEARDKKDGDYLYPFRSVFSLKSQKENTFQIKEEQKNILIQTSLPGQEKQLTFPALHQTETTIPVTIFSRIENNSLSLYARILPPKISIDNKVVLQQPAEELPLFTVHISRQNSEYKLNINGLIDIPASLENKDYPATFFSLKQDNILTLTSRQETTNTSQTIVISTEQLKSLPSLQEKNVEIDKTNTSLSIQVPKMFDNYQHFSPDVNKATSLTPCDAFRDGPVTSSYRVQNGRGSYFLSSENNTACIAFYSPTFFHTESYAVFIDAKNITGRGLHFWIENIDQGYAPIDTYLPTDKTETTSTFVLPPQDQFGKAYAFHFDNISIGKDVISNELYGLRAFQIPYNYLKAIRSEDSIPVEAHSIPLVDVSHPNESLYVVNTKSLKETLILSQGYHLGWKAYLVSNDNFLNQVLPFLFGQKLNEHVKINNWENGWVVANNDSDKQYIVLLFLPQYLQYFGFLLLALVPIFIYSKIFFSRSNPKQ